MASQPSSARAPTPEASSSSPSDAPRSGVRVAPKVPRPVALRTIPPPSAPPKVAAPAAPRLADPEPTPTPPPSSRAAVKPRGARTTGSQPAPAPPVSSKAQYFASLTSTREDWPIVPPESSPALSPASPTFGAPPSPVANPRHSLPAFLPPKAMSDRRPALASSAAAAANDEEVALDQPLVLAPVVIDEVVLPMNKQRLGGAWLFGLGVVTGALLTWALQSL